MTSKPITLEVTARSYATSELPHAAFEDLDNYTEYCWDHKYKDLMTRLKELQCVNVEYNGHFGAHVYFTLALEDDTAKQRKRIISSINAYLVRAEKWRKRQRPALY